MPIKMAKLSKDNKQSSEQQYLQRDVLLGEALVQLSHDETRHLSHLVLCIMDTVNLLV